MHLFNACVASDSRLASSKACSTSTCSSSRGRFRVAAHQTGGDNHDVNDLTRFALSRRALSASLGALSASLLAANNAQASKLGPSVDRVWSALGGGPPDLVFPPDFLGTWMVQSTLVNVQQPLGEELVPDPRVVQRAVREDLNKPLNYTVAFTTNAAGQVVPDRAANTASLMEVYLGGGVPYRQRIKWDVDDPNSLSLDLPGGTKIFTRVTKRSEEWPSPNRIETSEYFEQVFDRPDQGDPKVTASQCYTKYLYRSERDAGGGPPIVATQVVSDYLTNYDNAEMLMQAMGKAVVVYTYRMAFFRPAVKGPQATTA